MPQAALMLIPLAFQGIQMGMSLAGVGAPSPSEEAARQQKSMQEQQALQDKTMKAQQTQQAQASMRNIIPGLQEQLGGAVAPEYLMSQLSAMGGVPGDTNTSGSVVHNWLGLPETGGSGGGGGGVTGPSPTASATSAPGSPSTNMFPSAAVPAYGELSGGSM